MENLERFGIVIGVIAITVLTILLTVLLMPQIVLLVMTLGISIAIITLALGAATMLPPPPPPPDAPEMNEGAPIAPREREGTPVATIPMGSSILLGLVVSALAGLLTVEIVSMLAEWAFPEHMEQHDFLGALLFVISWIWGILAAVATFYFGRQPLVPIGSRAIPLVFGGRWQIFLFPEGYNWWFFGIKPVDMRNRPLIPNSEAPEQETMEVQVSSKVVLPQSQGAPTAPAAAQTHGLGDREFLANVRVEIAARIETFDPDRYESTSNAEDGLANFVKQRLREFAVDELMFNLPFLKERMTEYLHGLKGPAAEMGINFRKLMVTEVRLPDNIVAEAEKMAAEAIQRETEYFQAVTFARAAEILRAKFPGLSERALRDMVLISAGKVNTTTVTSISGTTLPYMNVNPQAQGGGR